MTNQTNHLVVSAHTVQSLGHALGLFQFTSENAATWTSYRCFKRPLNVYRFSQSFLRDDHFLKAQKSASVWYRSCRLYKSKEERSTQALSPPRIIKPTYLQNLLRDRGHTPTPALRSWQGAESSPRQDRLKLWSCIWNWLQVWPAAASDAKLCLCSSSCDFTTTLDLSCVSGHLWGSLPSSLPASWRSDQSSQVIVWWF